MNHVAFLGTGLLGSGMVEAMLRRGTRVTVWNRTEAKARALESLGAQVAATPEQAVAGIEEIHIALSDDAAVDALVERISAHLAPGAVIIDHSTTAPAGTKARLERAVANGIRFLHAPVFMSPQMCRDSVGLMMVSGPSEVYGAAKESLAPMTGEVWYLGERPDLAAAYKIFGNSMLFVIAAGLSDIVTMAKGTDVPALDAVALFTKWKVGSVIPARADKIARGDYSASFELTMARKDIRLMIEAAGSLPLTVLPSIAKRMDEAIAAGHGKDDLAAIAARDVPN